MFQDSKLKQNILLIALLAIFFGSGYYFGLNKNIVIQKEISLSNMEDASTKVDFAPFWKVWHIIDEKSPNPEIATDQDRVYGAIKGLLGSLKDPYTSFFTPDEANMFESSIAGNFSGVGMEIGMKDGMLTVIAPLKDTPAYKAGIKSGDKILKIDDAITSDMSIDKAIKLIRGEKGTEVKLNIFREGDSEPREIKIIRDTINVPTLDTEMKDGIFTIKLYSFTANSADLFRGAIKKFTESGTNKLVLDLRGNPGGYLDAAVDMTSWFLPSGKTVVIEDAGKNSKQKNYRSQGYNIFNETLHFVILIDGGSASASEIFAGAMKDYNKALLVGTKSYGKGSVQEVVEVTPDTILKITIAKWLTPKGISISEKGLTPDYEVKYTAKDAEGDKDPQMDKAVEILNNWDQYKK